MKILVMCGNGLGSSFMMEINVKKVLKELGKTADVDHTDLTSAASREADIYVATEDIMVNFKKDGVKKVALKNIMDLKELKEKLSQYL
jgi:PTS system ascorbate-specific IIB component